MYSEYKVKYHKNKPLDYSIYIHIYISVYYAIFRIHIQLNLECLFCLRVELALDDDFICIEVINMIELP